MNRCLKIVSSFCIAVLVGCAFYDVVVAQPPVDEDASLENQNDVSFIITCSPDKPTVWPRESISVRAWVSSEDRQLLRYTWSATGGQIQGSGPEVRWDFTGVKPGTYIAKVKVIDPNLGVAECSVKVIVKKRNEVRKVETGWSLLLKKKNEEAGYGLYSYLLFGSRPTEVNRERYKKAIEAYLWLIPNIIDLENCNIPRNELNIIYLPVKETPPEHGMSTEWVFTNYDYARARALLRLLPGDHRDGPYIISLMKPLSELSELTGQYLYQDLSRVPPHVVSLWAKEFFNQAAQERFWEKRTAKQLVLKLRTTVAILAKGFTVTRDAMDGINKWIAWSE